MTSTLAGWYVDPENTAQWRWWDGVAWTEHNSARFEATAAYSSASAETMRPYSVEPLRAPEGTEWNTAWIWTVVVVAHLPTLGLFAIDWSSLVDFTDPTGLQTYAFMFTPAYLLTMVASWLVYGLLVWFSYLDYRELERRGVPRPFHWAWAFLASSVYVIGRSVVVKNRTGRGHAPMWAEIVSLVASFGVAIYVVIAMTAAIFDEVQSVIVPLGL